MDVAWSYPKCPCLRTVPEGMQAFCPNILERSNSNLRSYILCPHCWNAISTLFVPVQISCTNHHFSVHTKDALKFNLLHGKFHMYELVPQAKVNRNMFSNEYLRDCDCCKLGVCVCVAIYDRRKINVGQNEFEHM